MGQAKRRGTFEQRKAEALVRDQINRAAKAQRERTTHGVRRRNKAAIIGMMAAACMPMGYR
jgi:hypothetical protein